ncbi:MAG TPA: hypothetical protein VHB02_11660 [Acidimicrobiales bacterium]|nr:hypothetical protein [Acidimicrobiales bacterium]
MSPQLHNIFGEDGEVLTILSLLQQPERAAGQVAAGQAAEAGAGRAEDRPLGEMTLHEAILRIYDIAGEEGRAQLVLSLRRTFGDAATDAFTADQNVTVAELSAELLALGRHDTPVVLQRMTAADEPEDDGAEDQGDDTTGGFRDALHRFVQALRNLFNAAGEDGEQLTILSLLVRQPPPASAAGPGEAGTPEAGTP